MISLLRRPSGWVPLLLSVAALALVVGYALTVGVGAGQRNDEGAAARIFQLTMLAVALAIAFFAVRWPVAPMAAMRVVLLQLAVASVPVITILLLER